MTTAAPSTALVTIQPVFTDAERLALAGFLAGYRGLTREAYALDLRQFTTWCLARSLNLFAVRRADIEGFARDLEARGRARATVTRRLCTIAASTSTPSKPMAVAVTDLKVNANRPMRGLRLLADRHAGRPDVGFLCVHEPVGPGIAGYIVGLDGRSVSRGSPGGGGIGTGCAAWTSPWTRSGGSAPG